MDDIRFIIDFAQRGQLDKIIRDLERTNILMEKNIELQGEQGNAVQRAASDFDSYSRKLEEISKKLQLSADAKQFVALTAEIARLKKEYDELSKSVEGINEKKKKQKELTDAEILAQERLRASMNARRKAAREQIKDEEALNYTIETQTRSIEELRKKNNALVRQRERLDTTTREGREQFDRLTVAIRENERALLENDQAIGRHQRNVGNYRSALQGLNGVLGAVGIGIGISEIASAANEAVKAFENFDGALKELSAITGLAGNDLDFFKSRALEVGSTTTTSANEYLEAVKLIASAKPELLQQPEALDRITNAARVLAEASGLELPAAATALTDALNQFNAGAEESEKFMNALAAGAKFGSAEVPEVTEALLKFGAVARQSNVTVEESVALIEALAERGIKGAEAGTALRNVLLRLSAPDTLPKDAIKAFQRLGVNIGVLSDKTLPLQARLKELQKIQGDTNALVEIFGKENAIAAANVIEQTKRIGELTQQVTGTNTAFEQASIIQESAQAESERLTNKMETLKIEIGERLLPVVNALRSALVGLLGAIKSALDYLSEPGKTVNEFATAVQTASKFTGEFKVVAAKLFDEVKKGNGTMEGFVGVINIMNQLQPRYNAAARETQLQVQNVTRAYYLGRISMQEWSAEINRLLPIQKEVVETTEDETLAHEGNLISIDDEIKKKKELAKVDQELRNAQLKEKELTSKEKQDREIQDLEAQAKRRKTVLIEEITDEEQLRAEQYDLERQLLENKIAVVEKYEGDATDLKLQLAELEYQRKKEIADREMKDKQDRDAQKKRDDEKALEEEKKREDLRREFIKDTMEIALSALNEEAEKRIELASEAVDKQKQNIDIQREMAAQGLENTLAFEKELAAQKERELLEAQKRAERIKKIEAYYNLVASYAETDPNTAPAKALIQMTIAEAIAGRFEHGGIVAEEIAKQNKGILRGPSHRNGGILIEAEGDEGIFSRKEMARLGRDRFHAIKDALNSPNSHLDIKSANEDVAMAMIPVQQKVDIEPLRKEMQEVKRAIEDKPVPMFIIDRNGNLITKQQAKNQIRYTVQKNKGFN